MNNKTFNWMNYFQTVYQEITIDRHEIQMMPPDVGIEYVRQELEEGKKSIKNLMIQHLPHIKVKQSYDPRKHPHEIIMMQVTFPTIAPMQMDKILTSWKSVLELNVQLERNWRETCVELAQLKLENETLKKRLEVKRCK